MSEAIAVAGSVTVAAPLPVRRDHRCTACGYGAVLVAPAAHLCPLCGNRAWTTIRVHDREDAAR